MAELNHTERLNAEMLNRLAQTYGSSFYLLNSVRFRRNYAELTQVFRAIYPRFNIAYSYKTNYIPKLCQIVNEQGGYAEVVSEMEMEIALRCGVQPERIIWNGPVKDAGKMEWLMINGGTVHVDSLAELHTVLAIAQKHPGQTLNIGLRSNFDVGDGVVSRFGMDTQSAEFAQALALIKENPALCLSNLHCHFARRQAEYWPARAKGMLAIADRVQDALGYLPKRIDLGGGIFGKMPDSLKKQFAAQIPDYQAYALAAAVPFAEHFKDLANPPELLVEPGTALAGDSMKYVCRVAGIKNVRGKAFATLTGSQKNISMTGVNPPLEVIAAGVEQADYADLDMVGYTCIESDVLYRGYCGRLAAGDFVVFENCGSYSIVMKPPFILPNVPVLDICGDHEHPQVIKRAETFEDVFGTYCF